MAALLTATTSDYSQAMVAAPQPAKSEEAAWIRRAQQSDKRAFEALYRLHIDKVYGLCLRMTGNVSEAEDCAQETFIQAWNKLGKFRGDSAFSTSRSTPCSAGCASRSASRIASRLRRT